MNADRWKNLYLTTTLVAAAIVHAVPATGIGGRNRLQALYGTQVDDADVLLLLRHRAVLFAILATLLIAGALIQRLRTAALTAGLVSTASFPLLALGDTRRSNEISTVSIIDVALALSLLAGLIIALSERRMSQHVTRARRIATTSNDQTTPPTDGNPLMNEAHRIIDTNTALSDLAGKGLWFEELTRRTKLSTAIYQLPPGSNDPQAPHGEEELYDVIAGEGIMAIAGTDRTVTVGDLIDVPAGAKHHFHSITATLQLLAVFAPAFGTIQP